MSHHFPKPVLRCIIFPLASLKRGSSRSPRKGLCVLSTKTILGYDLLQFDSAIAVSASKSLERTNVPSLYSLATYSFLRWLESTFCLQPFIETTLMKGPPTANSRDIFSGKESVLPCSHLPPPPSPPSPCLAPLAV